MLGTETRIIKIYFYNWLYLCKISIETIKNKKRNLYVYTVGEINEKQTHVSILISIILLSIMIHYVTMPFLYEYSFPFQILIGMSTLFIDIIACSYILYFQT